VKLHSAIAYLLTLLALAGLLLAPVVRPAMAMSAMDGAAVAEVMTVDANGMVMAGDMPCCPGEKSLPDCSKDCPLLALCVAMPLQHSEQGSLIVRRALVSVIFPDEPSDLTGLADAPPRRPPKI
jgi:hypothetical protein